MVTRHDIYLGQDSRRMDILPDESVHLVVTSPPYWQLKDYEHPSQLGFHDSYEQYINNLNLVWQECARVLHPGCRMAINIGDQFARSAWYGRYKVIPIRTEIIRCVESLGLDHMGAIIWRKVTTCNTTGGGAVMGSFPFPRNGIVKMDYEFILLFKKPGKAPRPLPETKEAARMTNEDWNTWFSGHWSFPGERQKGHVAMFPEELPRRLISMFTFPGEVVLDPFAGSGTTTLAAARLDRSSVACEINTEFAPLIQERLGGLGEGLPENLEIHNSLSEAMGEGEFQERISGLPYVFSDPVAISSGDRSARYGSRVRRGESTGREESWRVQEVSGADRLVLEDGREVALLGVVPREEREGEAREFLLEATRGTRVYLRDERSSEAGLSAYVHLRNRTHLNAHLIKRGFALADGAQDHRMKRRFERYQEAADQAAAGGTS